MQHVSKMFKMCNIFLGILSKILPIFSEKSGIFGTRNCKKSDSVNHIPSVLYSLHLLDGVEEVRRPGGGEEIGAVGPAENVRGLVRRRLAQRPRGLALLSFSSYLGDASKVFTNFCTSNVFSNVCSLSSEILTDLCSTNFN